MAERRDEVQVPAALYRLSAAEASEIIGQIRDAVSRWRAEAEAAGLTREEIDRLAVAFPPGRSRVLVRGRAQ